MSDIMERLDSLREKIQEPDYLEGRGLSNEVNIRIFCYDPEDEMIVQHFAQQLQTEQSLKCRVIERNLYQVFLDACSDFDIVESCVEMEEEEDSEYLLSELQNTISKDEFLSRMQYSPHQTGDVLMLTGIGDVFPFMRVHVLLSAMQASFSDIPILVLYPGEFDGRSLRLFNRLKPNDYYRAFNGM